MQEKVRTRDTERIRVLPSPGRERWQAALIQAIAIASAFALLVLIQRFATALILLFLGIGIGQAVMTPVDWLGRWMPRALAVVLVYLILAGLAAVLFVFTLPPLWVEARSLVLSAPHLLHNLQTWVNHIAPGAPNLSSQLQGPLHSLAGPLLHLPPSRQDVGIAALGLAQQRARHRRQRLRHSRQN